MELWSDRVMELSSYVVMGLTGFDYMGFERIVITHMIFCINTNCL